MSIQTQIQRVCTLAILVASGLLSCTHPGSGQFRYEIPEFGATLSGPNFEYVRFGVVGKAKIDARVKHMIETEEIGLVNEALGDIYRQLDPSYAYGPIALVNVVIDISKQVTSVNGVAVDGSNVTYTSMNDDFLVIRADVVRFTARLNDTQLAPSPAASKADLQTDPGRLSFHDLDASSKQELARLVRTKLDSSRTVVQ